MRPIVIAALIALAVSCGQKTSNLPSYGVIPDFELTAQTGAPFSSKALEGKVWIADFIFTTCTGPCPRMSTDMSRLQQQLPGPNIALVSFTVDPARDTPEALATYAKRYKADTTRWHFLTGPQPVLHSLAREAFKLHDVDGSLGHSTRFVLVDGRSRIRGYYATSDPGGIEQLVRDAKQLAQETSG